MCSRTVLWGCLAAAVAATAAAHDVVLVTGDVLHGEVAQHTTQQLVLDHPVLGKLIIPADKIKRVTPAVAITPPSPWTRQLEAGVSGASGNATTSNSRVALVAVRQTDRSTLTLDASHNYCSSNHTSSKDKFTAGLLHDWLVPESPWFAFASARVDADQFQSWDQRIAGHAGAGRQVVARAHVKGNLRGGLGAAKERGSDDEELRPEALLGGELAWQISERQKLTAATRLYPDLADAGEFRALSNLAWTIAIDRAEGLSLKLGLEHEYQSQADPGNDSSDFRYISAIVLQF